MKLPEGIADVTLDMAGKLCPMPLLMAHRALKKMSAGQTLLLISDDATTLKDIESWSDKLGYKQTLHSQELNKMAFLIKK